MTTEADLTGAIANLTVDLGDRFDARMPWENVHRKESHDEDRARWAEERREDVAAIRGYVRAIRILRNAIERAKGVGGD